MADALFERLLTTLIEFQLERRRVRSRSVRIPFGDTEANILLQLDSDPGAAPSHFAATLGIDLSTVRKAVKNLERKGYLHRSGDENDRRCMALSITAKGRRSLTDLDHSQGQVLQETIAKLSQHEQKDLRDLLEVLADGFGAAKIQARETDHRVTVQLRRVTRATGVLGQAYLATPLSFAQFCLFMKLVDARDAIRFKDLARTLPIDPGNLSKTLGVLERDGWVARYGSETDKRAVLYGLTKEGRRLFASAHSKAVSTLRASWGENSPQKLESLIGLLAAVVAPSPAKEQINDFRIRRIRTEKELRIARAFYLQKLVLSGTLEAVSETIFARKSKSFFVEHGDTLVGVIELSSKRGSQREVRTAFLGSLSREEQSVLIDEASHRP